MLTVCEGISFLKQKLINAAKIYQKSKVVTPGIPISFLNFAKSAKGFLDSKKVLKSTTEK